MRPPVLFLAILPLAALAQDPEAALMAQAQKAYQAGDDTTAKTSFSEVLQLDPHNTLALQFLRNIAVRHAHDPKPNGQIDSLVLPKVEFREATFSSALNAIRDLAAKQSVTVSFVSQLPAEQMQRPVSVSLTNIPFTEALRYLCSLNAATYRLDPYAIVILPAAAASPAP